MGDVADDMSGAGLDTFELPTEPDLSELTTALSRVEEEISQRKCYEIESIDNVIKCRDLQKRWKDYKAIYNRQKAAYEEHLDSIGLVTNRREHEAGVRYRTALNRTKSDMENTLASYQTRGCVELIGRVNGAIESLEKDLQDAGITE